MSGLGKSGRAGIPNKNSLVARAEMDRLGINPIEMLKRVFDEAMKSYETGRGMTEKGDSGVGYLATACAAAKELAGFKHPKLSAIAVKDVTSEESQARVSMTTQEALKVLQSDPILKQVTTGQVVEAMATPMDAPILPKGGE